MSPEFSKVQFMKIRFSSFRKGTLLAFLFLVGLASSLAQDTSVMDDRISNNLTFKQIREKVSNSLPPGTPLAEILEYFKNNNVEHG